MYTSVQIQATCSTPPPDYMMVDDINVEWIGYHQSVVSVICPTSLTITPFDTDDGYLEWYYRISHPCLVPPHRDMPREVPVHVYES